MGVIPRLGGGPLAVRGIYDKSPMPVRVPARRLFLAWVLAGTAVTSRQPEKEGFLLEHTAQGRVRQYLRRVRTALRESPSSAHAIGLLMVVLPGSSLLLPIWILWLERRKAKATWGAPVDRHV